MFSLVMQQAIKREARSRHTHPGIPGWGCLMLRDAKHSRSITKDGSHSKDLDVSYTKLQQKTSKRVPKGQRASNKKVRKYDKCSKIWYKGGHLVTLIQQKPMTSNCDTVKTWATTATTACQIKMRHLYILIISVNLLPGRWSFWINLNTVGKLSSLLDIYSKHLFTFWLHWNYSKYSNC